MLKKQTLAHGPTPLVFSQIRGGSARTGIRASSTVANVSSRVARSNKSRSAIGASQNNTPILGEQSELRVCPKRCSAQFVRRHGGLLPEPRRILPNWPARELKKPLLSLQLKPHRLSR